MSNCSSACLTKDHATWGECVRAKSLRLAYGRSHLGVDASKQKKWDAELDAYASARAQGIQPEGTQMGQIQAAVEISEKTQRPFDATKPLKETSLEVGGEVVSF